MITANFAPEPPEPDDLAAQLARIPKRHTSTIYGSARRASSVDIWPYTLPARRGQIPSFQNVLLALENPSTRDLHLVDCPYLYLPDNIRERHAILFGLTGSGKTQRFIYPAIEAGIKDQHSSNFVVATKDDDSRIIRALVAKHRPDHKVLTLSLADRFRSTTTWNPFGSACKEDILLLSAIETFIKANHVATDKIDSFWDGTSTRIIAGVCQRLEQNFPGRWSPADIHQVLELPRKQLLSFLKDGPPLRFALSSAAFIESTSHNAETSLAFAQSNMRCFADEHIAAVTSSNGFDYNVLFSEPTVLVLEVPLRDQQRIRPLLNVFVTELFRQATAFAAQQKGNRLTHPLNVFLDDFPVTTGRIEEFPQQLNLVRSIGVRILAAAHSIGSIQHFFGSETPLVLAGLSTKIFVSPVELSDAEYASRNSGSATVNSKDDNEAADPGLIQRLSLRNRECYPIARKLLLPEEVRLAPRHPLLGRASTVFLADEQVFQGWFMPAFQQPSLRGILKNVRTTLPDGNSKSSIPLWIPRIEPSTVNNSRVELSHDEMRKRYEDLKQTLFSDNVTEGDQRLWCSIVEDGDPGARIKLCLYLAEALVSRNASVADFIYAFGHADTGNYDAMLHYMDYWRIAKSESGK